jgi:hypothetical protein
MTMMKHHVWLLQVRQMEYDALGAAGLGKVSGYAMGEPWSHSPDVAGER